MELATNRSISDSAIRIPRFPMLIVRMRSDRTNSYNLLREIERREQTSLMVKSFMALFVEGREWPLSFTNEFSMR
jgi:hypothetical protein